MSQTLLKGPISTNNNGDFVDETGCKVTLRGINVDGGSKLPFNPNIPSYFPSNDDLFWDGECVSFIGRPFPLSEAKSHFLRIKSWGFNVVRYIVTWEALEHKGPDNYDDDFIDYTCEVLKIIEEIGGIYVFIDPHQDCWSRFSGGSGSPLWTLYAAGFNPKHFKKCGSAIIHGDYYDKDHKGDDQEPEIYTKMLWPSNYYKLATGTMFTLFFSGELFAPNATINGENIQSYLQSHFINSFHYLLNQINIKAPELFDEMLLGIELMNEPSMGFYGREDITKLPPDQELRVGSTPTLYESLQMGVGQDCVVDDYRITTFGPMKMGQTKIDPSGTNVWLTKEDAEYWDERYNWKRGESWEMGKCLWSQNGLWDYQTNEILNPDFFAIHPKTGEKLTLELFTNSQFVDYFAAFKNKMRLVKDDLFILMHSIVLQAPPKLIDKPDLIDNRIIYSPHYYDGLSLMSKSWNTFYNIDTLGVVRGKYINPVFGIVVGENNIRKCIRNQFMEMKKESKELLGPQVPVLMSETGMPFDMDNCKAYKENDFESQTKAIDALGFALEGADISVTWWCYCSVNSHSWGDEWNCEDFSFYSPDDKVKQHYELDSESMVSSSHEDSRKKFSDSEDIETTTMVPSPAIASTSGPQPASSDGVRAVNAVIRPYALRINGTDLKDVEFDLKNQTFKLTIGKANSCFHKKDVGRKPLYSEIFLPKRHFKLQNYEEFLNVNISSGNYTIDEEKQLICWRHAAGEQSIEVKNYPSGETDEELACGGGGVADYFCSVGSVVSRFPGVF